MTPKKSSTNPGPGDQNALLLEHLGRLLAERGDYAEAEVPLRESAGMIATLFAPDHPFSIGALGAQAALAYERQRYDEAAALLSRSAEACDAAELEGDTRCIANRQLLADTLLRLGRLDEAAVASSRSLDQRRKRVGESGPDYANALRTQASVLRARGDATSALAAFDAALAANLKAGVSANLDVANLHGERARTLLLLGKPEQALSSLDAAETIVQRLAAHNRGRRLRLLATRADALLALRRDTEATALAREAISLQDARGVLDSGEWEHMQTLAR